MKEKIAELNKRDDEIKKRLDFFSNRWSQGISSVKIELEKSLNKKNKLGRIKAVAFENATIKIDPSTNDEFTPFSPYAKNDKTTFKQKTIPLQ
jgi:hypothetical protein